MSKLNNIIGELSELNNLPNTWKSDEITIDLHKGILYIYSRYDIWKGVMFRLDDITKILHKYHCGFYMSDTRYSKSTVCVTMH